MLQTGHGDRASIGHDVQLVRASRRLAAAAHDRRRGVLRRILDTCYEDVQRFMVWSCCSRQRRPHVRRQRHLAAQSRRPALGLSPHGGTWGATPWNVAMNLPGSGRPVWPSSCWRHCPGSILSRTPSGQRSSELPARPGSKHWIWSPKATRPKTRRPAPGYFAARLKLPTDKRNQSGRAASHGRRPLVYLNGQSLGAQAAGMSPGVFARWPGACAKARTCWRFAPRTCRAPARTRPDWCADLEIEFADGSALAIDSDDAWWHGQARRTWLDRARIDDSSCAARQRLSSTMAAGRGASWPRPAIACRSRSPPAFPGKSAIIYVPVARNAATRELEAGIVYDAVHFDPATGDADPIALVQGDSAGTATVAAPTGVDGDWVLSSRQRKPPEGAPFDSPGEPQVFLFRGQPLVLLAASEHYGSVVNRAFDFKRYLAEAADKKQTMTRTFLLFREHKASRNPSSPIKPESPDYIAPWPRVGPGKAIDGEPKYDLDQWNAEYFERLAPILWPGQPVGHRRRADAVQQHVWRQRVGLESVAGRQQPAKGRRRRVAGIQQAEGPRAQRAANGLRQKDRRRNQPLRQRVLRNLQ